MAKESSRTVELFEIISKVSIYFLVFLLPIFFLPWTANILDFNKQALLIILVFLSLFAYALKSLISGKVSFNLSGFHIVVILLFLVYLVSTILSLWPYGSFWGWPFATAGSLFSLIGLILFYFLVVNIFAKKEIFYLTVLLAFSSFLAMLYGIFQLFGKFLVPLDFTKAISFNTIGTVNSLGIFAAVLLPLIVVLAASTKKIFRIFFVITAILSAFLLILINFSIIWWVVITASVLLIILIIGTQKKEFFDNRWIVLPMIFLVLGMFFIFSKDFFKLQIPGAPARPVEVFLTHKASFEISKEVLKEKPILGSGPGTFVYDFSKYKKLNFNENPFWNVRFEYPSSRVIEILATTGILGALLNLVLIIFFIILGIKFFFRRSDENQTKTINRTSVRKALDSDLPQETQEIKDKFLWTLSVGLFISFIALNVGYALYTSSLVLDFVYFFLIAGFIALISSKKEFILKPSSLTTFSVTFIFTLIFIFGLGVIILEGQRYAAEVSYLQGVKVMQEQKSDDSIRYLETAMALNPKMDLYRREVSQVYLQKINEEIVRKDLTQEEITQRVGILIKGAVDSIKLATDFNPKNVANWSIRGFIYQNLIGLIPGSEDWAMNSYDEAIKLEPNNPYFLTQKGIIFIRKTSSLSKEQNKEKEQILSEAKGQFEKAISLKSDYAPARFQISVIYQLQGKIKEAISTLEETKKYAPSDIGLAFQLGLLYYQDKNYQKAQTELERAIKIDPNYANALYFSGLTYDQQGDKIKAIEKFQKVADLNLDNQEIKKILENLKSGKKALEGIAQEVPPQAPIEEKPQERLNQ